MGSQLKVSSEKKCPNYKLARVTHCEVNTVKFAFHQMHKATSRMKRKIMCPARDCCSTVRVNGAQGDPTAHSAAGSPAQEQNSCGRT